MGGAPRLAVVRARGAVERAPAREVVLDDRRARAASRSRAVGDRARLARGRHRRFAHRRRVRQRGFVLHARRARAREPTSRRVDRGHQRRSQPLVVRELPRRARADARARARRLRDGRLRRQRFRRGARVGTARPRHALARAHAGGARSRGRGPRSAPGSGRAGLRAARHALAQRGRAQHLVDRARRGRRRRRVRCARGVRYRAGLDVRRIGELGPWQLRTGGDGCRAVPGSSDAPDARRVLVLGGGAVDSARDDAARLPAALVAAWSRLHPRSPLRVRDASHGSSTLATHAASLA